MLSGRLFSASNSMLGRATLDVEGVTCMLIVRRTSTFPMLQLRHANIILIVIDLCPEPADLRTGCPGTSPVTRGSENSFSTRARSLQFHCRDKCQRHIATASACLIEATAKAAFACSDANHEAIATANGVKRRNNYGFTKA